MHVLFVHQNHPAQFGHIASYLAKTHGWRCTFVSERDPGFENGVEKIQYHRRGGASIHNSFHTRTFETATSHAEAVYRAIKARKDVRPDLIVAHSGFGSSIFLPQICDAPIVNLFEYYYRPKNSDMDFRPDSPISEKKLLRSRVRNGMILLDLEACTLGYTPTMFQKSVFPTTYHNKLRTVFDGVETDVFKRHPNPPRTWGGRTIGPNTRIVTYCARGFERMRGFDMFMKAARVIYSRWPDVVFLVAGTDKICYGGDQEQIGKSASLRHYLFEREKFDLSKFIFTGWLSREDLAAMISVGNAHIYYTVPFVLSWSMMNALSCGAIVCGSDTAPVREMIKPGYNGFLADFFDPEQMADRVIQIFKDPAAHEPMRANSIDFIRRSYSLQAVLPRMLDLYETAVKMHKQPAANLTTTPAPGSTPAPAPGAAVPTAKPPVAAIKPAGSPTAAPTPAGPLKPVVQEIPIRQISTTA
jgi:glycosyltransferase involved in cell wall biosynthesis